MVTNLAKFGNQFHEFRDALKIISFFVIRHRIRWLHIAIIFFISRVKYREAPKMSNLELDIIGRQGILDEDKRER